MGRTHYFPLNCYTDNSRMVEVELFRADVVRVLSEVCHLFISSNSNHLSIETKKHNTTNWRGES